MQHITKTYEILFILADVLMDKMDMVADKIEYVCEKTYFCEIVTVIFAIIGYITVLKYIKEFAKCL